jgi:hypothetical protein
MMKCKNPVLASALIIGGIGGISANAVASPGVQIATFPVGESGTTEPSRQPWLGWFHRQEPFALECEQSTVSAHYLSVNDEDHLPRGLTDAALLGQTLGQLLAS